VGKPEVEARLVREPWQRHDTLDGMQAAHRLSTYTGIPNRHNSYAMAWRV
jgi:hypothetical protein